MKTIIGRLVDKDRGVVQSPLGPPLQATIDNLAERLHERYAAALCVSDLGPHSWGACDSKEAWRSDADAIVRR